MRFIAILIAAFLWTAAASAQQLSVSSGDVANATATATIPSAMGHGTFIFGFDVTSTGATASGVVVCTVSGLLGGTISYVYAVVEGVKKANEILNIRYSSSSASLGLQASDLNVPIVVSCPALGAGNAHMIVTAYGIIV